MLTPPRTGVSGFTTALRTTSASSSPKPCKGRWRHARRADILRQVALFGAKNRDGWGVGLTILTALGNLLPGLPEDDAYLALFQGARRVAADCDGQAPRRGNAHRSGAGRSWPRSSAG